MPNNRQLSAAIRIKRLYGNGKITEAEFEQGVAGWANQTLIYHVAKSFQLKFENMYDWISKGCSDYLFDIYSKKTDPKWRKVIKERSKYRKGGIYNKRLQAAIKKEKVDLLKVYAKEFKSRFEIELRKVEYNWRHDPTKKGKNFNHPAAVAARERELIRKFNERNIPYFNWLLNKDLDSFLSRGNNAEKCFGKLLLAVENLEGISKQKRNKQKAFDELGTDYNKSRWLRRWIQVNFNPEYKQQKIYLEAKFTWFRNWGKYKKKFDPTRDEREKQLQDSSVSDPKNEFTLSVAKDEFTTKSKKYGGSNDLDLQTGKVTKKEYDPSVEQDWWFNDALSVSEEDMFHDDDRGDLD